MNICSYIEKSYFINHLKNEDNIVFYPGGFYEASLTEYGKYNVYIPIGFIKYCLLYGYSIVPCYVFNENLSGLIEYSTYEDDVTGNSDPSDLFAIEFIYTF